MICSYSFSLNLHKFKKMARFTLSELETEERHQSWLLIVETPRATINAVVIGVEA